MAEVDPKHRFALQAQNVRLGWLALAISWVAAVVAAIHDRHDLIATALLLGYGVFRVTQRNRLEQRSALRSWADRIVGAHKGQSKQ
jgi:hypothetical protein